MSKDIVYSLKYAPTLKRFYESDKQIRAVQGPWGSGKSVCCVFSLLKEASNQVANEQGIRRTRYLIVRNTYRELQDSTKKTVLEWLPEGVFGTYVKRDETYNITITPGDGTRIESEWMFRALDDPNRDIGKLLSVEYSGAWINEYRQIPRPIFDAIDGRIGRFPPAGAEGLTRKFIVMDTNPPDYDHWAYKLFEEEIHANPEIAAKMELFKQPSGLSKHAENIPFLDKRYYQDMAVGKDKDWIRVNIEAEYGYVKSGKPVYQNYSDQLHVAPKDLEPIRGIPIIIGMDFASCPSAIICQGLPSGRFNVLREVIGYHGQVVRTFLADVLRPVVSSYYSGFRILVVGDPSGINTSTSDGSTCFKELRAAGFKAIKAKTNAIQARLAAVDSLLTSMVKEKDDENLVPKLQLSPSLTPVLRKGFMGEYKYREAHSQFGVIIAPTPMKNEYADAHDGLQYAALGYEKIHMAENADYEAKSRDNSTSSRHSHEQVKSALY